MGNSTEIRLSPEAMLERADQFESCGEQFTEVVNQMSNLVVQLSEEWSGNASETFRQKFEELHPHFTDAADLVSQIAAQLRSIASVYSDTDADIARQIG